MKPTSTRLGLRRLLACSSVAFAMGLAATGLLRSAGSPPLAVLEAKSPVLKDDVGGTRAIFAASDKGVSARLFDAHGNAAVSISVEDSGVSELRLQRGEGYAALRMPDHNSPQFEMEVSDSTQVFITAIKDGPLARLEGGRGSVHLYAGVREPGIAIQDGESRELWKAPDAPAHDEPSRGDGR